MTSEPAFDCTTTVVYSTCAIETAPVALAVDVRRRHRAGRLRRGRLAQSRGRQGGRRISARRGRRVIADSPRILAREDRAAYVAADAERPR